MDTYIVETKQKAEGHNAASCLMVLVQQNKISFGGTECHNDFRGSQN